MFKKLTSTTLTPESRLGKDPDFCYMLIKISLLNNVRIHETNVRLLFITLSTANLRAFITFLWLSETFLNHTGGCQSAGLSQQNQGFESRLWNSPKMWLVKFRERLWLWFYVHKTSFWNTDNNLIHVHGHKLSILNSCWQSNMDNS